MPVRSAWQIRRGDSWRSRRYAVVIAGQAVDLTEPGWSVSAQFRTDDGAVLNVFHVLLDTATVQVTGSTTPILTSTVQAGLTAAETATLPGDGPATIELRKVGGDHIDDTDLVFTLVDAYVALTSDGSR